jgi:PhnB protein
MKHMSGYLSLSSRCREAMAFYQKCFGGELTMMTVRETPIAAEFPEDQQDHILHAMLTSGNIRLMGNDYNPCDAALPSGQTPRSSVSLYIDCESEAEIERLFSVLSEGGSVQCPVGKQFWGSTFAALTDQFGIGWMLGYDG